MRRHPLPAILAIGIAAVLPRIALAQSGPSPAPVASPNPSTGPSETPRPSPSAAPSPTAPPAGTLPANVSLMVTGNPAGTAFLQTQIAAALERAIGPTLQPGATVRYGATLQALQVLGPGFVTSFDVPVTITAPNANPVQGVVHVDVQNVQAAPIVPAFLALDDDPEYIRTDGVLFRGTVDPSRPTRVYYYHGNVATPRRFLVTLGATAQSRVQLIDASAGPNADVMSVGHAVSRSFVVMEPQNEGIVADIVPGAPFVLRNVIVAPGAGVAGAVDVHVLMGAAVTMTIMAIPPDADPAAYADAPLVPQDGHNRHGLFAISSVGQRTVAYTVGGPEASVEYGNRAASPPNVDPNDPGRDAGDYGIVQHIAFDIANPLDVPATVYLYEQPVGGPVRNSFVINGALVDVGCARLSQRYQVGAYQVPGKNSTTLDVLTMTDGGSNYPLELGVSTAPPQPTTPPISAPDGCFPKPTPSPGPPAAPQPSPSGPPQPLPSPAPSTAMPSAGTTQAPQRSVPPPPTPVPS